MTANDNDELKRLRRENARLGEGNETHREAAAHFARELNRPCGQGSAAAAIVLDKPSIHHARLFKGGDAGS
ncbi:hypothetical protein [Streptomyces sp. NBC_00019]|uniref:hypothetical protein n=1 Tax=Streptomyces sp. NBC_00019 TaxID=2975623 RepID=UPI003255C063